MKLPGTLCHWVAAGHTVPLSCGWHYCCCVCAGRRHHDFSIFQRAPASCVVIRQDWAGHLLWGDVWHGIHGGLVGPPCTVGLVAATFHFSRKINQY